MSPQLQRACALVYGWEATGGGRTVPLETEDDPRRARSCRYKVQVCQTHTPSSVWFLSLSGTCLQDPKWNAQGGEAMWMAVRGWPERSDFAEWRRGLGKSEVLPGDGGHGRC